MTLTTEFASRQICNSIRDYTPPTFRSYLRGIALDGLSLFTASTTDYAKTLATPRVHFLCLHSVFTDEEKGFRQRIEQLAATNKLISYSEAVHRFKSGDIDAPYVAFSFDDGMKNNLAAARILEEYGVSGCFFVVTDMVGEQNPETVEAFCHDRLEAATVEFLNWDELGEIRSLGHEIGSHSASHRRMSNLCRDQIIDEMVDSRDQLIKRVGQSDHFAWPYGRATDAPSTISEIALEVGYESCASAIRGCHVAIAQSSAPHLILRREQIMCNWPMRHINYFMAASVSTTAKQQIRLPAS